MRVIANRLPRTPKVAGLTYAQIGQLFGPVILYLMLAMVPALRIPPLLAVLLFFANAYFALTVAKRYPPGALRASVREWVQLVRTHGRRYVPCARDVAARRLPRSASGDA